MSSGTLTVEPTWVGDLRTSAAARFAAFGFPTTKNEDWQYTSVKPIAEGTFAPKAMALHNVTHEALAPYLFGQAPAQLVIVNGVVNPALSDLRGLPDGVTVQSLRDALTATPELVRSRLGAIATDQPFTALNASKMTDGFVVHVAKDRATAATPIHILHVTDKGAAGAELSLRNLIVLDAHATATVIESYVGLTGDKYFTNSVTECDIADGATLHHLKVQRESLGAYHVAHIEARQGRDSHFVSFSFAVGGQLARTNVYTLLGGEGCGATLNGLYVADGTQHIDHQTRIEHAEPNCFSRELYKGVLGGEGHGVFNGKVYVHPVAQKTDGKQENHTLLLSDKAKIDTKPQLEIFADDVRCTHGATVGRMDQTSLFYMKSRGVPAEMAKQLLVYAFAADVLETIENEEIKASLEALVMARYLTSR